VLAGGVVYPFARAREVLHFYHTFACACPDELSTVASLWTGADGDLDVSIGACYSGNLRADERAVRPLRAFGPPVEEGIRPMDFCTLQRGNDGSYPEGRQHYWKSAWLTNLSDGAIEVMLRYLASKPSAAIGISLQQLHGAAARVAPAATAFPHRGDRYDFMVLSQWDDPADSAENIRWTRECFAAIGPFLERGVYVNDLGVESEDRVRDAYGANYDRLTAIKARYDPDNLFRVNHNIWPLAQA
jgi:hypothetical protein